MVVTASGQQRHTSDMHACMHACMQEQQVAAIDALQHCRQTGVAQSKQILVVTTTKLT